MRCWSASRCAAPALPPSPARAAHSGRCPELRAGMPFSFFRVHALLLACGWPHSLTGLATHWDAGQSLQREYVHQMHDMVFACCCCAVRDQVEYSKQQMRLNAPCRVVRDETAHPHLCSRDEALRCRRTRRTTCSSGRPSRRRRWTPTTAAPCCGTTMPWRSLTWTSRTRQIRGRS